MHIVFLLDTFCRLCFYLVIFFSLASSCKQLKWDIIHSTERTKKCSWICKIETKKIKYVARELLFLKYKKHFISIKSVATYNSYTERDYSETLHYIHQFSLNSNPLRKQTASKTNRDLVEPMRKFVLFFLVCFFSLVLKYFIKWCLWFSLCVCLSSTIILI